MGTRGLRVWRFRKRYFTQYHQYDSYPSGWPKDAVAEIPQDPKAYQEWIESQKAMVSEWFDLWEKVLSLDPEKGFDMEMPDFLAQSQGHVPALLAPLNDTYIEYIYVVDLDNETLSVNNGAHFKLNQVSSVDWKGALADGGCGDKIILPGQISEDAIVSLLAKDSNPVDDVTNACANLVFNKNGKIKDTEVIPKGLGDIPWTRRHGPNLNCLLLFIFSRTMVDGLAANLLQWTAHDFAFREIAYALLCMALGGKYMTVIPISDLKASDFAAFVNYDECEEAHGSFLSVLATGSHLQHLSEGTAPEETVYWLEGVLVVLVTRLYEPNAIEAGITQIIHHGRQTCPDRTFNAVLMSIEHVVLVKVMSENEIERTGLLCLFDIPNHLTMDTQSRYTASYLDKLKNPDEKFTKAERKRVRAAQHEAMLKEGIDYHDGKDDDEDDEEDEEEEDILLRPSQPTDVDPFATFYALFHLFDGAARTSLAPMNAATKGCFPPEIYVEILDNITDADTRHSCTRVSRAFRDLCQEHHLINADIMILPDESIKPCVDCNDAAPFFRKRDMLTGAEGEVNLRQGGGFLSFGEKNLMRVAIGTEKDKKSLLPNLLFKTVPAKGAT